MIRSADDDTFSDSPPTQNGWFFGGRIHEWIEMKEPEPDERLGIPTLGLISTHVAHGRRFMRSETKHQALYGLFFPDTIRLVLVEAIAGSV